MVQDVPGRYLSEIVLDHCANAVFINHFPCFSEKHINWHVPVTHQEYEQPEFWTKELQALSSFS